MKTAPSPRNIFRESWRASYGLKRKALRESFREALMAAYINNGRDIEEDLLSMPYNLMAENCQNYNYASGRLDYQAWHDLIGTQAETTP